VFVLNKQHSDSNTIHLRNKMKRGQEQVGGVGMLSNEEEWIIIVQLFFGPRLGVEHAGSRNEQGGEIILDAECLCACTHVRAYNVVML
jgi:hypothetical protein